ncbi:hypothetical protein R6Q57_018183 [Mikania cordata]
MKLAWKKNNKKRLRSLPSISQLPFDHQQKHPADEESTDSGGHNKSTHDAESFEAQGNKLAEVGKYHEALGKWEVAITLKPERATLHEQKAQVLLEIGETWKSLKAATLTSYQSMYVSYRFLQAWVTLGRAQLNFGEPDSAIESFDKAIAINVRLLYLSTLMIVKMHIVGIKEKYGFQVQWLGEIIDLSFVGSQDTTATADDADLNHGDSIFDNQVVPSSSSIEIAPIAYMFRVLFRESKEYRNLKLWLLYHHCYRNLLGEWGEVGN